MKFKLFTFVLILINCLEVDAQTFKWKANLEPVQNNGFYKVALSPQLISTTENTSLSDIRLFEKNKEIAYLIRKASKRMYTIPAPLFNVKDDQAHKRTVVGINFNAAYQIDKLVFNLDGFKYYKRKAWLTTVNPLISDKKKHINEQRLENLIISSTNHPIIELFGEKRYKQLYLVIENEDNEPLTVKNIDAYQKRIELIAYLEKDKQYILKTGQLNMPSPRYDLDYFKDSISNSVPFIQITDVKLQDKKVIVKESTIFKKSIMWLALGLLILFLAYLSYFMVKDMQRKK